MANLAVLFLPKVYEYLKPFLNIELTMTENLDEEGLLKDKQVSELALKITKLSFKWNNYSDPIKEAHVLMSNVRKLSLEISEYEHRIGSKLNEYQRNIIYDSMEDLGKLIPSLKNKIKHYESLENIAD